MFWAPKNVTFFHLKLLLNNSTSFTSSRMKDLCQKWKVKLIFWGACRLPETGIVECLKITDVGCNLKQFDGLTWLIRTPPPSPYFTTDLRRCLQELLKQFLKPFLYTCGQCWTVLKTNCASLAGICCLWALASILPAYFSVQLVPCDD